MKNILKGLPVPISLAILALVFIALDAQAYQIDGRNDFMCVAIFKVAFEQEAVDTHPREEKLSYYSDRISILRWKLTPTKDTYETTVFNNRVSQYMDELDSADVLLHMDRCKNRALEVYAEYLNKGDWRKKG